MEQQFVQAIQVLLNENGSQSAASLKEAEKTLISIIQRNEGWGIISNVLNQAVEQPAVAQHCAIYLRNKIMYDFNQLQSSQVPELSSLICRFIRMYVTRNNVLKQLALCFADLAIYFSPSWTTSVQDINTQFPANDSQNCLVLLHVYVACAEEIANERLIASAAAVNSFKNYLHVGPILQFLESLPQEMLNHGPTMNLATQALALYIPFCPIDSAPAVLHHRLLKHCRDVFGQGDENAVRCFKAVVKQLHVWIERSFSPSGFTAASSTASYNSIPTEATELRMVRDQLGEMLLPVLLKGLSGARISESEVDETTLSSLLVTMGRTYIREFQDIPFDHRSALQKSILEALVNVTSQADYQRINRRQGDVSVPHNMFGLCNFWMEYAKAVRERDGNGVFFLPAQEARLLLEVLGHLTVAISLPSDQYASRQPNLGEGIQETFEDLHYLRHEVLELACYLAPLVDPITPFFRSMMDRMGGTVEGKEVSMFLLKGCAWGIMGEYMDYGYLHEENRNLLQQVLSMAGELLPAHAPESFTHAALRASFMGVIANLAPFIVSTFSAESPQFRDILMHVGRQVVHPRLPAEQRAVDEWIRQGLKGVGSQVIHELWDVKSAALVALTEFSNQSPLHISSYLNTVIVEVVRAAAHTLNFDQRKRLLEICVPAPGQLLPSLDVLVGPALQTLVYQSKATQVDEHKAKEALFELSNLMRSIFNKRDSFLTQPELRNVPELPGFVMKTLWPCIRDICIRFSHDEVIAERGTKALRAPFRLLGADALQSILPEVVNFLMHIYAAHGHCSCLYMADWLGCLMIITDSLKSAAFSLWDLTTIACLRHLSDATVTSVDELRQLENHVQAQTSISAWLPQPLSPVSDRFHENLDDLVGMWAHLCEEAPLYVTKSPLLRKLIDKLDSSILNAQLSAQKEGVRLLLNLFRLGGDLAVGSHGERIVKPCGHILDIAVQVHSENAAQDRQALSLSYTDQARLEIASVAQQSVNLILRLVATDPPFEVGEVCVEAIKALTRAFPEEVVNSWVPIGCSRLPANVVPESEIMAARNFASQGRLSPADCVRAIALAIQELHRKAHFVAIRQSH